MTTINFNNDIPQLLKINSIRPIDNSVPSRDIKFESRFLRRTKNIRRAFSIIGRQIGCGPQKSSWIRDLTRECIESNPGPSPYKNTLDTIKEDSVQFYAVGVYKHCHNCGSTLLMAAHTKCVVIFSTFCKECSDFHPQSFLSGPALEDITSRTSNIHNWLYNGASHGKSFLEHYVNIPASMSKHINLFEDICLLAHQMVLSRNIGDRYLAVINFCKLRGSRIGFTSTLMYLVSDLFSTATVSQMKMDAVYEDIEKHVNTQLSFTAQKFEAFNDSEHDNVFAELRAHLGAYERMKETVMYKKLHKFLLYVLTVGMLDGINVTFDSLKFDKYTQASIKRHHQPGVDMVFCMLDTICFVCDKGLQYFKSGDPNVFYHSGGSYEKWVVTANRLIRESKLLCNPEPHGLDRFKFINELKEAIEKGGSIVRFTTGLEKAEKLFIQRMLFDLQMIESNELTKKAAQQPRKDPFAILLHGSSNICKSQLKQILFYHYGKVFGLQTSAEYMYTRCPTDEYWSGFNSTQWCIVMDDIAFLKPNGEVDPTLKEMLQVKNSVPYVPPQAALEDKGRTPVRAELIIGTTNTRHLNLHAYFACPFAIARRMSYVVTARVKPEYTRNSFMADSSKIPVTPDGEYMDIWNFDVSVPTPQSDEEVDAQQTKYVITHTFTDIHSFLRWYIGVAKEHESSQSKASKADKTMMALDVCQNCFTAVKHCVCGSEVEENAAWCTTCGMSSCICINNLSGWDDGDDDTYVNPSFVSNWQPQAESVDSSTSEVVEEEPEWAKDTTSYFKFKVWCASQIILGLPNEMSDDVCDLWYWCYEYAQHPVVYLSMFLCWPYLIWPCIISTLCYLLYTYVWVILHFYFTHFGGIFWKYKMTKDICGHGMETHIFLMRLMGERIKQTHFSSRKLRRIATLVSAPIFVAMVYRYLKKVPKTEGQSEEGVAPTPMSVEKPTFYYQDPYVVTGMDVSGASKCAQGDVLAKKLARSTVKFIFKFDSLPGRYRATTALNIRGNVWLFNAHTLVGSDGYLDVVAEPIGQNISRNITGIRFGRADIVTLDKTDFAFIVVTALPPGPDLTKYFATDAPIKGRHRGEYTMINRAGDRSRMEVIDMNITKCPLFHDCISYIGKTPTPTVDGDCGSPCLSVIGGAQIIMGIHTAGSPDGKVIIHFVSKRHLLSALNHFVPQVEAGVLPISAPGYTRELVDVHPKSGVRFIERGTADVVGSFSGYRPKHKTKVKKTFIHDEIVKLGYKDTFGSPDFSYMPWYHALSQMSENCYTVSTKILVRCRNAYVQDIIKGLGVEYLQKHLEFYSLDTALNGADGVAFVDRMNLSTSAGNPFKKSKKNFLEFDEHNKVIHVDALIMNRVAAIEECYANGIRFHPQFCGHLKDEALPQKKIDAKKTRVFTAAEFAWCLVVRQNLLSFIRVVQNNPFLFESMPGIVAQSIEWTKLYKFITTFGINKIVAGDYGKFDKRMIALFILEAFEIIIQLYKTAGASQAYLMRLRCIAHDTAYANIDFNGCYIQIQGNPSGHPLTVIINCLVNCLYMRYAFCVVCKQDVEEFKKYVHLATYGDDNIMGVSDECPEFNHTNIVTAMASIGVEYTMAEKEAESVPYIHVDQSSFLKRKFVMDADVGAILAPLDPDSFNKMLTNYVDGGTLAPEAHSICVIETAVREYFFYGRAVFEEKKKLFQQLVETCNLSGWVRPSTFPTFDSIAVDFWLRFGDVERAKRFQGE